MLQKGNNMIGSVLHNESCWRWWLGTRHSRHVVVLYNTKFLNSAMMTNAEHKLKLSTHKWPAISYPHGWPMGDLLWISWEKMTVSYCPACRTSLIATRFWVVVICPIIKCLTVLEFSFILFDLCLFITIFNFNFELCTNCNILDIYLS